MSTLSIEVRPRQEQTEFNLRRWAELLDDPEIAHHDWRIETDRHGHIIMSPPPAPNHGAFQVAIGALLNQLLPTGKSISECPISTIDGIKAADVAWGSRACWEELGNRSCFIRSPEICVEILSPGNTDEEIREKMTLYFEAGAREVWICDSFGALTFFGTGSVLLPSSQLCPTFPSKL